MPKYDLNYAVSAGHQRREKTMRRTRKQIMQRTMRMMRRRRPKRLPSPGASSQLQRKRQGKEKVNRQWARLSGRFTLGRARHVVSNRQ